MHELLNWFQEWYNLYISGLNPFQIYLIIMLLMAIESSFVPLPSELVLPPAAFLAYQGQIDLSLIILFATIGCVIGALFNYTLSIFLGRKIIYALAESRWARIFFITPAKVEHAEQYFLRNGNSSTFIGRLIPGVRHLISIPAGLSKMNLKNFIIYTAIGSAIWNAILTLVSYFLFDKWEVYFREIKWGFIILGVGFIVYLIVKNWKREKK